MPTFYELLKPHTRDRLARWYEKVFRKKFRPPGMTVHVEPDIERIMKEPGRGIKVK